MNGMNGIKQTKLSLKDLEAEVIGAAYEVSNILGAGFLEKVYHRALQKELTLRGISVRSNVELPVTYKGENVGEYIPDLLVEDRLIIELKCVERFAGEHIAQCLSYLCAAGHDELLLINFQKPKVDWRRIVRTR